jgi:hypothetical protein
MAATELAVVMMVWLGVLEQLLFAIVWQRSLKQPGFGGFGVDLEPLAGDVFNGGIAAAGVGYFVDPSGGEVRELICGLVDIRLNGAIERFILG